MGVMITKESKKEFIKIILSKYKMKRKESVWILNYFLSHENILDNVHFIRNADNCPKTLIMSTVDSLGVDFKFCDKGKISTNEEFIIFNLRNNLDTPLYVQLHFPNQMKCIQYLEVLEENPFLEMSEEEREELNGMVGLVITNSTILLLEERINKALDEKDEVLFLALSKEYIKLTENQRSS